MLDIKNKITIQNIVFIAASIFLAFWSLYYNSINNIWIMVVTIVFIICQSIYVKHLRFDINLCFLMETFFVKAMLDQHTGKSWMVPTTIAMPMLAYLFGKLIVAEKVNIIKNKKKSLKSIANLSVEAMAEAVGNQSEATSVGVITTAQVQTKATTAETQPKFKVSESKAEEFETVEFKAAESKECEANAHFIRSIKPIIVLAAMTIGTTILGLMNFRLTRKSPIAAMGFYSVAFTGDSIYTDKWTYLFNFIFIGSLIAAALIWGFYKATSKKQSIVKYRVPFFALISVAMAAIGFAKYHKTENYLAFKEGVHLIITKHWGNFGLDLTHNSSTSNMWLDYGRDYGILVFATLFIFMILTVKDVVKLVLNRNVDIFLKSWLLVIFIGINVYYFIDATAYVYPCIWYLGLIVCGVLSEVSHRNGSHS